MWGEALQLIHTPFCVATDARERAAYDEAHVVLSRHAKKVSTTHCTRQASVGKLVLALASSISVIVVLFINLLAL